MKFSIRLLKLAFLTAFFSLAARAQTPVSTPPPAADEEVVKISTALIQVDVTVTDKKGRPVTDLKPEDFVVLENGEPQDITNFSYIAVSPEAAAPEPAVTRSKDKNRIAAPPVNLRREQVRRTYALVVDDLGLSFASVWAVKRSLRKFVEEQMQPGDLVAILRVSGGIGALQSFTSDRRQLLAAVEKIRWNGLGRIGVNSYDPISPTLQEQLDGTRNADGSTKRIEGIAQNRESEIRAESARQSNLALGSLGALGYVIKGMRELPGRKSVLLFSEGFQTFDYSATGRGSRLPETTRILDELRALADLANRATVVIYTMDPRGMQIPRMAEAMDDVSDGSAGGALALRENKIRDSQNSLRYLALETGGLPYVDQNDLGGGIEKALSDQTGYYLLGYQPDTDTFDPKTRKFNKLTVRVNRPRLDVRYRSGFFGVADEDLRRAPETPQQRLVAALTSPFGTNDVKLNMYPVFYNDAQNRSFVRALVHIDAAGLAFTREADGLYRARLDSIATIFDSNGAAAGNGINPIVLQFTEQQLARVRERGVIYDLSVPIVKSGAYQFRVALRDTATGKIGAASHFIEVPDLNRKKLTLSNLIVKNYSPAEWKKISMGQDDGAAGGTVLLDTTVRQFRRGTYLTYSFVVYNAKAGAGGRAQLKLQPRLFHNGRMIMEGAPSPIDASGQTDLRRIQVLNAATLGSELGAGDYALQVVVSDEAARGKDNAAVQWIDFEITDDR